MTLIQPINKREGHSFCTSQILISDFQQAVNSNFGSRTHRLATIHNVTDERQIKYWRRTIDGFNDTLTQVGALPAGRCDMWRCQILQ